jgi:tetratricopeptide (TPR) repeat protein
MGKIRFSFVMGSLVVAGAMAGCATLSEPPAEPQAAQSTVEEVATVTESLSGETLYDILLGDIARQRGRDDLSAQHWLRAALASEDPRVARRAARIALVAHDYQRAYRAARRWFSLNPEDTEALQAVAALAVRTSHVDEAVAHLEQLVAGEEDAFAGYRRVSALLLRQPVRAEAMAVASALAERHADEAGAQLMLAQVATHAGKLSAALQAVERALQIKPDWTDAIVLHARILFASGKQDEGVQELVRAVEEHPDNWNLRLDFARLLVEAKRHDEAREQFERLSRDVPDDADVLYALGLLTLEAKREADAARYFERLFQLGTRQDEAAYYLGNIAESEKDYEKAVVWYRRVKRGEYHFEAQLRMAISLGRQDKTKAARRQLQAMRERYPREAVRLYLAEGELLRHAKDYQEGMSLYDEALREFPGNVDLLYARGLLGEKIDRIDILEQDLRDILEKEPENAHALNALGYTLADRTDRYQEALELIERAIALEPEDPAILDSMGWVLYRLGRLEESLDFLRRAFKGSNDGEIAAHLGEVLWQMGNRDEATRIWNEALEREPGHSILEQTMKRLMP